MEQSKAAGMNTSTLSVCSEHMAPPAAVLLCWLLRSVSASMAASAASPPTTQQA